MWIQRGCVAAAEEKRASSQILQAGAPGREYFRELWHHWWRPKAKQAGLFATDLCQQCRLKTEAREP